MSLDPVQAKRKPSGVGECEHCHAKQSVLFELELGTKLAIQSVVSAENVPDQVCEKCLYLLGQKISKGAKMKATQKIQEEKRLSMWKSRLTYIRKGKQCLTMNANSDAALAFEKYLKILEIVFNVKAGELKPAQFSNSFRSRELTLVTTVYWDLLRIYDYSKVKDDKLQKVSDKLVEFLPHCRVYPDIIRKLRSYKKIAKNKKVINTILSNLKSQKGPCFIATAIYQDPYCDQLLLLRKYRDQSLKKHWLGRQFVYIYYKFSPLLTPMIEKSPLLKRLIAPILNQICVMIR